MSAKYPNVHVQLTGQDGNAFFIMARVAIALKRAGVNADEMAEFRKEALSGNYDKVLQTVMEWVEVS